MVGIILEIGRLMIESPASMLHGPVVLMINGGEETLSQAAHGFMAQHRWADGLGAFINLESGGTKGLEVMFQSTGDWTAEAYAQSAIHPRGNVVAQDIFLAGLIPADTDFRMFSAQHYGTLPGIDIAYVLGAHQYHTYQDKPENLVAGTLQMMGINTVAAALEMSSTLRFNQDRVTSSDSARAGHVFFDVLSTFMVTYSADAAAVLHKVPLLVALPLSLLSRWATLPELLWEAAACLASLAGAVLSCSLLAVARVLITGVPLAWFGRWWLATLLYIPPAVAGALLPRLLLHARQTMIGVVAEAAAAQRGRAGTCLVAALASAALSHYDLGSAYLPFVWAICLLGVCVFNSAGGSWRRQLVVATCGLFVPMLLSMQVMMVWLTHMWQKIGMGGSLDSPAGVIVSDYATGVLTGLVVWLVLLGCLPTLSANREAAKGVLRWCSASFVAALVVSMLFTPYTQEAPKRVFVQHYHEHDHLGRVSQSSWVVAAMDSVPVQTVLRHPSHPLPSPGQGHEWLSIHPIGKILQTVVLPAPPAEAHHLSRHKYTQLRKRHVERLDSGDWMLHIDVLTPQPGWGALNITGPIRQWSFTESVPSGADGSHDQTHIVRFAGNEGSEAWSFWLQLGPSAVRVRVEAAVMFLERTPLLAEFLQTLPLHTSPVAVTTLASNWTFRLSLP